MSTKKLREAVERLDAMRLEQRRRYSDDGIGLVAEALKELEAIERAAVVVTKDKQDEYVMQGELESAYDLMQSIAREAK